MKKSRLTESQIVSAIKKHEAGVATKEIAREMGVSEAAFYQWKAKYGGMEASKKSKYNWTLTRKRCKLSIDSNAVERAIRPVAIGRKNNLFAESHEAAQRPAMIHSLFATCTLHGINPYNWLKDVPERMHEYTMSILHKLLPQNRKPVNQ